MLMEIEQTGKLFLRAVAIHKAMNRCIPHSTDKCSWPKEITGALGQIYMNTEGEGNGTPLQYSCLENPMDGGAWKAAVHGVTKSQAQLSDFTFTFYFHALEKEMATHSSVLASRIPGMGEPGGLPSMGLHRVGHDWSDLAAAAFSGIIKCKAMNKDKLLAQLYSIFMSTG